MIRFFHFFFIIFVIFLNTASSKSENLSIAYVDADMIINNSKAGEKFFSEINLLIQKKKKKIQ